MASLRPRNGWTRSRVDVLTRLPFSASASPSGVWLRGCAGHLLGLLIALWARSWRVRVLGPPEVLQPDRGRVVAFWHGLQMGLLASPRRGPLSALVSWSRDGELQAAAMRRLGLCVVRGSSSRGGARGLLRLVRSLKDGQDVAIAVDGPKGPLGSVKPGAARAARRAGALLVPAAAWSAGAWVLGGAWDRFRIPWPFTRVVVCFGSALEPAEVERDPARLARALDACRDQAMRALQPELPSS